MYAQVEKPKRNSFSTKRQESRAVANSVTQKKSGGKQSFGFVDNRSEAMVQRNIIDSLTSVCNRNVLFEPERTLQRQMKRGQGSENDVNRPKYKDTFSAFQPVSQCDSDTGIIQRLTQKDIDELENIDDVDELVEWLITAIAQSDIPEAIEEWLIFYPDEIGRREEIYERVDEPMPDSGEVDEFSDEEGPIEKVAGIIYDGVGKYVCGSNLKESGANSYGSGGVCSDRFEECMDYFNETLSLKDKAGLAFWSFNAKNGKVNHVAFCLGPTEWDDRECWIVDPWAGFVCHIDDYEDQFANALEGCEVKVGQNTLSGETFVAKLKGKFSPNELS